MSSIFSHRTWTISARVSSCHCAGAWTSSRSRTCSPTSISVTRTYVLMTHAVFAAPRCELGRAIGNLATYRDAITCALDILLVGF